MHNNTYQQRVRANTSPFSSPPYSSPSPTSSPASSPSTTPPSTSPPTVLSASPPVMVQSNYNLLGSTAVIRPRASSRPPLVSYSAPTPPTPPNALLNPQGAQLTNNSAPTISVKPENSFVTKWRYKPDKPSSRKATKKQRTPRTVYHFPLSLTTINTANPQATHIVGSPEKRGKITPTSDRESSSDSESNGTPRQDESTTEPNSPQTQVREVSSPPPMQATPLSNIAQQKIDNSPILNKTNPQQRNHSWSSPPAYNNAHHIPIYNSPNQNNYLTTTAVVHFSPFIRTDDQYTAQQNPLGYIPTQMTQLTIMDYNHCPMTVEDVAASLTAPMLPITSSPNLAFSYGYQIDQTALLSCLEDDDDLQLDTQ